jgi:muramoyltetrapeptide carboxypeptidase
MRTDRRTALAGLTAATAGSAGLGPTGSGRAADGALRRPPRLREGDTVGLIAPASWIADLAALERIEATIRSFGLVPKRASNVLARDGYFAGPDRDRAAAVNALYADPEVRALWSANGGWGCQRILPFLDYRTIAANPKLLIGSSDVTALHLALAARTRCPTIHGPNAAHSWGPYPRECFRRLVFDAEALTYGPLPATEPAPSPVRTIRPGRARGRLLGGNLSVLSAMVGTGYLPDFRGAILFLEDTNEAEYRIDRMLTQLEQGGILRSVAGVVFGQCTNCRNPVADYSGYTIDQVLDQHFAGLGVPVYQGALVGHIAQHISVPEGAMVEIEATAGTLRVLEPVVT